MNVAWPGTQVLYDWPTSLHGHLLGPPRERLRIERLRAHSCGRRREGVGSPWRLQTAAFDPSSAEPLFSEAERYL